MHKNLKLLALAIVVAGCSTLTVSLPPVTESPTGQHNDGRVVWHDLLTSTPAESRTFYGDLFGWTFENPSQSVGAGEAGDYMFDSPRRQADWWHG